MKYELFYLVGASREADLENIRKEVNSIITSNNGVFEEKETVEKRRLAYKIKHETHGIYIAQRFELPEIEKTKDINNKLNLYPGVLRFVLSRADELPELKSKEERISESNGRKERDEKNIQEVAKKESVAKAKREKAPEEKVEEKKEEAKEKTSDVKSPVEEKKEEETQDDIDKKLEEILNI